MQQKYLQSVINIKGSNNRKLAVAACRVLTPWFPQLHSIFVDLFSFAALSIILCGNHGQRGTAGCKKMTQQLDGRGGEVAVALEGRE